MLQIELESPDRSSRHHEPVSCGIPLPRGVLRDVAQLGLLDDHGKTVRVQVRALDHWPDGSVRWALVDWQAVVENKTSYRVEIVAGSTRQDDSPGIQIKQDSSTLTIDTGAACFVLLYGGRFPFETVTVAAQPAIDSAQTQFAIENDQGEVFRARMEEFEIVEAGPLKALIRVKGRLTPISGSSSWCLISAYLHFFAGLGVVRFDLTLHNPRRARHPGNFWSLGEKGSIYIRDASLTMALPQDTTGLRTSSSRPSCRFHWGRAKPPLELYQDSSGGENWRGTIHVNRHDVVPNSFRGYRLRTAQPRTGRPACHADRHPGGRQTDGWAWRWSTSGKTSPRRSKRPQTR